MNDNELPGRSWPDTKQKGAVSKAGSPFFLSLLLALIKTALQNFLKNKFWEVPFKIKPGT